VSSKLLRNRIEARVRGFFDISSKVHCARFDRSGAIEELYRTLKLNRESHGRQLQLGAVTSRDYPQELEQPGIYFVFEDTEKRSDKSEPRVVRVGITEAGRLIDRLRQHLENSAFFTLAYTAWAHREGKTDFFGFLKSSWRSIPDPPRETMRAFANEVVLPYMKALQFTWLPVPELRTRKRLEVWATVLLSNYWFDRSSRIDPPSERWPGYSLPTSTREYEKVHKSGLWSTEFVDLEFVCGCELELEQLLKT
jgi:hypothetical protein